MFLPPLLICAPVPTSMPAGSPCSAIRTAGGLRSTHRPKKTPSKPAPRHSGRSSPFIPFCPIRVAPPLASDVQIFIGDADDWATASNCTDLVDKYPEDAPHRPSLMIYPGARHSFDANRPERVYFGHELAYDPKAAADAFERTRKFLDEPHAPLNAK